ncbi:AraC family transcriptional regulator [Paenibacillus turpanensis]|uniref:AraC family transcriptional regulator n=1 Tax=Paenibacillus turpanensis TaxID=2689078 RepID=UPI00140E8E17|nr:AraC family transcriptional regulator [Paenibacillus turpanensis]
MVTEAIQKPDGFASEKLFVLPETVETTLSKQCLTHDLYITDIGYFPHAKYHYRERSEGCEAHIFMYCAEGMGWVELGEPGTSLDKDTPAPHYKVTPQTLVMIPSGTPHRYGASNTNPWSIYWFHLKGNHVEELLTLYQLQEFLHSLSWTASVKLTEGFEQCYQLLIGKPFLYTHHAHASQTMRLLISSLGMSASGQAGKKIDIYLEQAIHFMTEHMGKTIKLDEIASYIGLSKQHLTYVFKEATGMPPMDYFLRMKMQRASQLLDLTGLSVKEVGAAVGIHDPYYFSRLFKKVMGTSPTHYRSILKG